jgi:hypothetical protein
MSKAWPIPTTPGKHFLPVSRNQIESRELKSRRFVVFRVLNQALDCDRQLAVR